MAKLKPDFRQSTAAMFLTLKDEPEEIQGALESENSNAVTEIPISEIDDFPDHPFHVVVDDAMNEMADSIKKHGVLTPAVVRKKDDGRYELVSGHRRKKACEIAGIDFLPAVVREMDRDESIIFMVDSNLQRESLLPSEKAFSYKMKMDALRRQAGRPSKDNSRQVGENLWSIEKVSKESTDSARNIHRFIRLTELIPPLLDMVDDKRIAFNPAVELSYLPIELQTELYDVIEAEECTPSLSQAQRMKQAAQEGKLNRDGMELVMREEKPQQNNITIKGKKLERYFPRDFTPAQKEERIIKALDLYCRRLERMKQENEFER
ncbi:MAG: ParB/RepB/Spo0J family partition protein [Suilimivivens sp.]